MNRFNFWGKLYRMGLVLVLVAMSIITIVIILVVEQGRESIGHGECA